MPNAANATIAGHANSASALDLVHYYQNTYSIGKGGGLYYVTCAQGVPVGGGSYATDTAHTSVIQQGLHYNNTTNTFDSYEAVWAVSGLTGTETVGVRVACVSAGGTSGP